MEILIIFLCLCGLVVVGMIIHLLSKDSTISGGCTGNCNQGRRCDCKDIK
jgi:hypothetical protein